MLRRTTSMPTPRPEMSDTVPAVENPGRKIRLQISSSVSIAFGSTRPFSLRLLQDALAIDAAAVVADFDDDAAAALIGGHPDRALFMLALGHTIGRRLDAVIDRVPDDVGQRIAEPLDDGLVDLGGLTDHLDLNLLAGLGGQLAHQARHALEHRAHRLGADRHRRCP